MATIRVGISGWSYPGWRTIFYPAGLPHRRELEYASRSFSSIEVNGSFYSLQKPDSYRRWYAQTPPGFCFAIKGSRFITHNKKLAGAERALANFFASGLLLLREKLGPILWQLSPALRFDEQRISNFLTQLPRTVDAAVALGRTHDARGEGNTGLEAAGSTEIRHALEARHPSFLTPAFVELCRAHRVALVISESADWPMQEEITTDFLYLRLHGSQQTYASRYTDAELDRWAARIRGWTGGRKGASASRDAGSRPRSGRAGRSSGRDAFIYFDNDAKVHAPEDARRLAARLGVAMPPVELPGEGTQPLSHPAKKEDS